MKKIVGIVIVVFVFLVMCVLVGRTWITHKRNHPPPVAELEASFHQEHPAFRIVGVGHSERLIGPDEFFISYYKPNDDKQYRENWRYSNGKWSKSGE
jgi:hypothetical protein